jgi:uncharacterized protein YcfJ
MKRRMLSTNLLLLGSSLVAGSVAATEFSDQAQVNSVRAVFSAAPQTQCWVDREQIRDARRDDRRGDVNVPGAVVGAIVGGVLGHQVGGGRGRDVATAGGAVAGAAIGGNVGRDDRGERYGERAVQRCEQIPASAQPDYWDVEYSYGGQVFHTQLNYAPGPEIPVRVSVEPE